MKKLLEFKQSTLRCKPKNQMRDHIIDILLPSLTWVLLIHLAFGDMK